MGDPEVSQIRIGGHLVGIIGLKAILEEVVRDFADQDRTAVEEALLARVGEKNYVVPSAREAYRAALYREYCKSSGRPLPPEEKGALEVKVLGPGCPECDRLERDLMAALAELELPADLEHVRDIREIACYGVMGSPALVINGKVVVVGRVPSRSQLREWLRTAAGR